MANLGHKWLQQLGLLGAASSEKICARAALEMNMCVSVGTDTYPMVWEGNVEGEKDVVQAVRRCMYHGSTTSENTFSAVGGSMDMLFKFLEDNGVATSHA